MVVKNWCNRRSALVPRAPGGLGLPFKPSHCPNTPPCAGPLLLQCTGDNPGHLTYRLHATPTAVRCSASSARSSEAPVRCRLGRQESVAMSSSYDDASGHDMSVLFYTVLPDIIVLSFHRGQCLCPGNRKETLVFQGCPLVTYRTCRPVTRTRLRAINSAQLTGVCCGSHVHIREFRNFNSLKAPLQASFWPCCFACALVRPALRLGCRWRTTNLVTDDATRVGHGHSPLLCRTELNWAGFGPYGERSTVVKSCRTVRPYRAIPYPAMPHQCHNHIQPGAYPGTEFCRSSRPQFVRLQRLAG